MSRLIGPRSSPWIVNGKPAKPVALRVIECGRRVHASGLREDVVVRVLGDWRGWWDQLQLKARTSGEGS